MKNINLYASLKEEFSLLIKQGLLHQFSIENIHYIYLRDTNTPFKIDELANRILLALRNDSPVDEDELLSFYANWREIRGHLIEKDKVKIVRTYFCQSLFLNDFEDFHLELELLLNSSSQWQISIQLMDEYWGSSQHYLDALFLRLKDILTFHNSNVSIEVKIPFRLIDSESLRFLSNAKALIVAQIPTALYNEDITVNLLKIGVRNIEIISSYFPWTILDNKIKNVFRLDRRLASRDSKSKFLKDMVEYLRTQEIRESVQNSYRIFNILTEKRVIDTRILSHLDNDAISNACTTCWARNICWASRNYEAFSIHPYMMVLDPENCLSTYHIIESMLNTLNTYQERIFLERNSKKNFQINDSETIELINP